jgi:hypothetical protein
VGDAGIGKSRLIAEVAGGSSLRVLTGQCLAVPGGGLPYAPLTGALRQLARETDPETLERLLGAARGELARLLPELSGGAPAPAPGPTGRADQARLFELLLGLLGRLTADGPTVLVVEDLHWLDDATRALLTFLARNLSNERLLLATCRAEATDAPADVSGWLSELARSPIVARIDLGPLSADEVAAQLAGILGTMPSRRLAASIAARSGGNALFAEELLAAAGEGEAEAEGLPATLAYVLLARVRGLTGPARDVTRMLAIAARPIDERLLAAATGLADDDLSAGLRAAVERPWRDRRPRPVMLRHVSSPGDPRRAAGQRTPAPPQRSRGRWRPIRSAAASPPGSRRARRALGRRGSVGEALRLPSRPPGRRRLSTLTPKRGITTAVPSNGGIAWHGRAHLGPGHRAAAARGRGLRRPGR